MKCERCGKDSATKHGLYRNKAGFHQKWKCKSCGTTWHDELVLKMGDNLRCRLLGHDWNYNREPTNEWPVEPKGPMQFTAVCDRCEAELFEDQTGEFDRKKHIINRNVGDKEDEPE